MQERLDGIRAVAFDLDGTLYVHDASVPGAAEAVAAVRALGLTVAFVTNTSGRTRAQIAARLVERGIPAAESEIYTSASATARWLADRRLNCVWATGGPGLRVELETGGLRLADDDDERSVDAVVVGLDRGRDVADGQQVLPPSLARRVSRGEALVVACNRDLTFPGAGGRPEPGCGHVVAQVEVECGRAADAVVGKPEPYMLDLVAARYGLARSDFLVVGDSWTSDVAMARACGSAWALVPVPGSEAGPGPAGALSDSSGRVLRSIAEVPGLLTGKSGPADLP